MVATTQSSGGYSYGQYNTYNIQLTIPLSVDCSNSGYPMWAVGTVYDTVTNTNLGSNNVAMNWNNGYSGQLTFNLPSSVVEHQLQVQIQVYGDYNNGQYSDLVATSSPTASIHASSLYSPPSNSYSYYNGYPTGYYNGYYYYSYPSYYYYSNGYTYYYYPYPYYYSYPSYYHYGTCYNGETIIYYNGAYYYASCYSYYHHH
jgi:hypothetical protein